MTKEEAKALLEKLGIKLDEIGDDVEEKIAEWKSGLDAETRRAVRPYWLAMVAIAFALGVGIGYLFWG